MCACSGVYTYMKYYSFFSCIDLSNICIYDLFCASHYSLGNCWCLLVSGLVCSLTLKKEGSIFFENVSELPMSYKMSHFILCFNSYRVSACIEKSRYHTNKKVQCCISIIFMLLGNCHNKVLFVTVLSSNAWSVILYTMTDY